MQFTPQFEADLLATCLQDRRSFAQIKRTISSDAFRIPQLKWLYELAVHSMDLCGELPSPGIVAQEAALSWSPEESMVIIEVHKDVTTRQVPITLVLNSVCDFAEERNFRKVAEQHAKLLEIKEYGKAKALMETQSWRVQRNEQKRRMANGYDDFERLTNESRARRDTPGEYRFSTGVAGLDKLWDGGYPRGDLVCIVAFTGRGKTTLLLNMIDAAIMAGHGGVLLSSEMREDVLMAKLYARRSEFGHNVIYEYKFSEAQEREYLSKMEQYKQSLSGLLRVEQLGISGMSRDSILAALDDADGFLKDSSWFGIDTIDHCVFPRSFAGNIRLGRGDNANWLKGIAEERDKAALATTQANREGFTRTELDNLAEHMELARVSPWVVAVNEDRDGSRPNPEDDIDAILQPPSRFDSMTLSSLKARMGRQGDVKVSTDLGRSFIGDARIEKDMGHSND